MATVKLGTATYDHAIAPGAETTDYSRGSVMNFTAQDFVSVSVLPKVKGAAFVVTQQSRGFADDDGTPTITYTVKNIGTVADAPDVKHLIVSD